MKDISLHFKAPQIAILGLAFFLSAPFIASASVIASQTVGDVSFNQPLLNKYPDFLQSFGSGHSETLGSITIKTQYDPGGSMYLWNETTSSFVMYSSATSSPGTGYITYDFSSSAYTLNPAYSYAFHYYKGSPVTISGSATPTYTLTCSDSATNPTPPYTISCAPVSTLYFIVDTSSTPTPPTDGVTISSPTAQTYYSNPITFAGTYTNGSGFDQMTFDLRNTTYNQQLVFSSLALAPMSVVNEPWTFNESLYLNGDYELKARLYNSSNGSTTPYTAITYFSLNSTSTEPLVAPTGTSTPVISCDPDSGYFQNSFCNLFVYLFSPSADVFNRFNTLKDDLKDHAPFGYFTSAYNSLSALSGSSTPAFALAEVTPIMTYIFTPLKTGLSWLIWIVALIFLYKRLTNIHI